MKSSNVGPTLLTSDMQQIDDETTKSIELCLTDLWNEIWLIYSDTNFHEKVDLNDRFDQEKKHHDQTLLEQ
jgi:hypothetical protein